MAVCPDPSMPLGQHAAKHVYTHAIMCRILYRVCLTVCQHAMVYSTHCDAVLHMCATRRGVWGEPLALRHERGPLRCTACV